MAEAPPPKKKARPDEQKEEVVVASAVVVDGQSESRGSLGGGNAITTGKSKKVSKSLNSKKARQKKRKGEKPPIVLKFVPAGDKFQYTPTAAALSTARRLFEGKVVLAPMVRAGTTPLRVLALKYGADTVFTEEIIDYKLMNVKRVANEDLKTIDFFNEKQGKKGKVLRTLLLRIDPAAERGHLIFQIGTSNGARALAALQKSGVLADVDGIDVNMGCPKHFSVQGGMGAALLANQHNAAEIVYTLSSNLGDMPVTAKIRLLSGGEGLDNTIQFMKTLERAGAAGIAIHLRTPETPSERAANWAAIHGLVGVVNVPVTINGDFMGPHDLQAFRAHFPPNLGAMVARGALRNCSLFSRREAPDSDAGCDKFVAAAHGTEYSRPHAVAPSAAAAAVQVAKGVGHGNLCTPGHCLCGEVQDDPACPDTLDMVVRKFLVRPAKAPSSFVHGRELAPLYSRLDLWSHFFACLY